MKTSLGSCLCLAMLFALPVQAQNELRGFEMPMTLSGAAFASHRLSDRPDTDSNAAGGLRLIAYPTLRISENWFFSGAIQIHSRPYLFEKFELQGTGLEVDTLQAYVGYERLWGERPLFGSIPPELCTDSLCECGCVRSGLAVVVRW